MRFINASYTYLPLTTFSLFFIAEYNREMRKMFEKPSTMYLSWICICSKQCVSGWSKGYCRSTSAPSVWAEQTGYKPKQAASLLIQQKLATYISSCKGTRVWTKMLSLNLTTFLENCLVGTTICSNTTV